MLVKVTISGKDFNGIRVVKTKTFTDTQNAFAWEEFLSDKVLEMKSKFDFKRA